MGAHSFHETCSEPDVHKAYDLLCGNAAHEDGYGAYSGTIATTRGVHVVQATPVTAAYANVVSLERISDLSKWSVCEAIAVGTPSKAKEVTTTLVTEGHPKLNEIATKLGVSPLQIVSYDTVETKPTYAFETVTPEKRSKAWFVEARYGRAQAFSTRSEALRAAKEAVKNQPVYAHGDPSTEVRVFQRDTQGSETVVRAELRSIRSKLRVTVNTGELKFSHWLFYGWAAS
jgi:hypothetical protein